MQVDSFDMLEKKGYATVGRRLKGFLEGEFSVVVLLLSPELFLLERMSN